MRQPFALEPRLSNAFPKPEELKSALNGSTRRTREVVARLWLSEGLPSAFATCPAVYEDIRGWLGSRLDVHPKEITIVGSGRLGYSLAPAPAFGRPFTEESDLDFCVTSSALFGLFNSAFTMFVNDYLSGAVAPRNAREHTFWDANVEFGKRNVPQGFFDANKIPNLDRYPIVQQVNQSMWALLAKLAITPGAPRIRRASTRVYRDWQSLIERLSFNLRRSLGDA